MARRLKNLVIDRVDVVDLGAGVDKRTGDAPRILIAKRDATQKSEPTASDVHVPSPTSTPIGPAKLGGAMRTCPACGKSYGAEILKCPQDGTELPTPAALTKAEWSTAYVNDLPDSSFAHIEPGGTKDAEGKTTPRSKRHLPYKDENGKVDAPHVRNALARLESTQIPDAAKAKAKAKLMAAAKTAGVKAGDDKTTKGLLPRLLLDVVKRAAGYKAVCKDDQTVTLVVDDSEPPVMFDELDFLQDLDEFKEDLHDDLWLLYDSMISILLSTADDKRGLLIETLGQFTDDITGEINEWVGAGGGDVAKGRLFEKAGRKISAARMKTLKDLRDMLAKMIKDADGEIVTTKDADGAVVTTKDADGNNTIKGGAMKKADRTKVDKRALDHLDALGIKEPTEDQVTSVYKALNITPPVEDVLKNADPALRAVVEKLQAESAANKAAADTATLIAKGEQDARLQREYIAKAQTFKAVGFVADDDWKVVREITEKLSPESSDRLFQVLAAAGTAIEKSGLFATAGREGAPVASGTGKAGDEVVSKARAKVEKSGGKLDIAAAISEVEREEPELYQRYRTETQVKV